MAKKSKEEQLAEAWYDHKSKLMELSLGREHDMVMHAIIPYAIGGGLDLYYYPNKIFGTGIATKELSDLPDQGSRNRKFSCYEMVMFSRHPVHLDDFQNSNTASGRIHETINAVLNNLAPYSAETELNPNETCEFPQNMETVGGKCLIFDAYAKHTDRMVKSFGLLLIMEIFRSEMDFARKHGGASLLKLLKENDCYPYSDLTRQPVA